MTKKVLIIGLNYSGDNALSGRINIALSGRINIAVNARGVFISDYGILEENITYLTDEWAPLTKAQITTAIQTLVVESAVLDEIYVYYAGYGSGIRIVKTVDYGEVPDGEVPLVSVPLEPLPVGSVPFDSVSLPFGLIPLEPLSEPLDSEPLDSEPLDSKLMEAKMIESKLWEAKMLEDKLLESVAPDDTITISIDELSNVELSNVAEPKIAPSVEVLETPDPEILPTPIKSEVITPEPEILPTSTELEILPTPTELEILPTPTEPEEPIKYKYEFYPPNQSYDKLAKQMVASDYEIIDATEILGLLSNSRCRTICVLDMCPYTNTSDPLMWGTDIIGNVNIISFAESDAVSSGKLAIIQVITTHIAA
jgi:hypothetical protein